MCSRLFDRVLCCHHMTNVVQLDWNGNVIVIFIFKIHFINCNFRDFVRKAHKVSVFSLCLNYNECEKPCSMNCCFYRCHTEFCYRCGSKYHHVKFLGNHYDRFSILGCKYNFKPDKPVQRIAVRGALFSGQVMLVPVVAGLVFSAGCVIVGAGVVAAPFYGSYVLIKRQKARSKQAYRTRNK